MAIFEPLYDRFDRHNLYESMPLIFIAGYVLTTGIGAVLAFGLGLSWPASYLQWAFLTGLVAGVGLLQNAVVALLGLESIRWEDQRGPDRRLFIAVSIGLCWTVAGGMLLGAESMGLPPLIGLVIATISIVVAVPITAIGIGMVTVASISLRALWVVLLRSGRTLPAAMGAREISSSQHAARRALESLAGNVPDDIELYVVDDAVPNAYAVRYVRRFGSRPRRAIILTSQLAESFEPDQLRAVIAYGIASLRAPRVYRESAARDMEALLMLHEPHGLLSALVEVKRLAEQQPLVDLRVSEALDRHIPWFESFVPWLLLESPHEPKVSSKDLGGRIRSLSEVTGVEGFAIAAAG